MQKMICFGYICFIAGLAISDIGNPRVASTGNWTVLDAIQIISFTVFPSVFGFLAGREIQAEEIR